MKPHTRAMVAASTFAILTGRKAAGIYDHSAKQNLKIAAECRGSQLRGFDGGRGVHFGGTLPELYDAGDRTNVSLEVDGVNVRGHDHSSASDYSARVNGDLVQVYDYEEASWFAYDIQDPDSDRSFHRKAHEAG